MTHPEVTNGFRTPYPSLPHQRRQIQRPKTPEGKAHRAADGKGTEAYNQALSLKRAEAVLAEDTSMEYCGRHSIHYAGDRCPRCDAEERHKETPERDGSERRRNR